MSRGEGARLLEDVTARHVMQSEAIVHSEACLMPPPQPGARKKKVILPEEEYVEALEEIIERDFFPDSATTARHLSLIDAEEKKDYRSMEFIRKQILEDQRKFGATPTPAVVGLEDTSSRTHDEAGLTHAEDKNPNAKKHSLTNFFKVYNSEDNESFEKLHAKDMEERKKKFHWLYDDDSVDSEGKKRQAGMLMWYHAGGKVLTQSERSHVDHLLLSDAEMDDTEKAGGPTFRPSQVDSWKFRVRNQLMFPPDLQTSRDVCALPTTSTSTLDNQQRKSSATVHNATGVKLLSNNQDSLPVENEKNAIPGSEKTEGSKLILKDNTALSSDKGGDRKILVNKGKVTISSSLSAAQHKKSSHIREQSNAHCLSLLDTNTSYSNYFSHLDTDKHIMHRNTRLKGSFLQDREKLDAALHQEFSPLHLHRMSTPSSVLSAPLELPHSPSYPPSSLGGNDTINIAGRSGNYRPVAMTPSPLPSSMFTNSSDDPLLTWGEIVGTPVILDPALSDLVDDAMRTKEASKETGGGYAKISDRRNRYSAQFSEEIKPELSLDINTSTLSDTFQLKGVSKREELLRKMAPSTNAKSKLPSAASRRYSHPVDGSKGRRRKQTPLTPAAQALADKLVPSSKKSKSLIQSKNPVSTKAMRTSSMELSLRNSYKSGRRGDQLVRRSTGDSIANNKKRSKDADSDNQHVSGTDDLLKF